MFYVTTCALWFVMAVVIYPTEMLTAIASVGGCAIVLYTMMVKFRNTKEQIMTFLKDEIPDILDLVCDTFIEEFDRTRASSNKQRDKARAKTELFMYTRMRKYLMDRLLAREEAKEEESIEDSKKEAKQEE